MFILNIFYYQNPFENYETKPFGSFSPNAVIPLILNIKTIELC